jgi:hypothetical protein
LTATDVFLPTDHRYRKNRKDFIIGRVEKDVPPLCVSGEELYDVVSEYGDIVFGFQSCKQKFSSFGLTYNFIEAFLLKDQSPLPQP